MTIDPPAREPARVLPEYGELARLARDDPEGYEALRRELIDGLIERAPEEMRPRLRGLQFRIDGVRRCSRSPLGATMKVYALMWESFVRLNHEMAAFRAGPDVRRPCRAPASARVIEFRPARALPRKGGAPG